MTNNHITIPPIKSQGIKTKLVSWTHSIIPSNFNGIWIEPFMGTGVVGFNLAPKQAIMCDTNPHLVAFYNAILKKQITARNVRSFLTTEGLLLEKEGEERYYTVRSRFNQYHEPLDFLFLNRACFNGMIRFNRHGDFNVPFCRKPQRFAPAYITKIVNQVDCLSQLFSFKHFEFLCQDFSQTISMADKNDLVYCDPPYIDRHADYYNGWTEQNEVELFKSLEKISCPFILSTWHHNDFRENQYINRFWNQFHVNTQTHFYHLGGKEENRRPMVEALITNYLPPEVPQKSEIPLREEQTLFDFAGG